MTGRILLDDEILFDAAARVHPAAARAALRLRVPELRPVPAHDAAGEPGLRRRALGRAWSATAE